MGVCTRIFNNSGLLHCNSDYRFEARWLRLQKIIHTITLLEIVRLMFKVFNFMFSIMVFVILERQLKKLLPIRWDRKLAGSILKE